MNETNALATRVRTLQPVCAIQQDQDKILVRLEMPGVMKENLNIHIEKHELTVSGKREVPEGEKHYLVRERPVGDYTKVFTVDDTIDPDKIDAALENGVLTLALGLKPAAAPRSITIRQK
jgi:HSP20 family protein